MVCLEMVYLSRGGVHVIIVMMTSQKNQACESEIQLLRDQTTQQLNTSETALGSMYALKMADDKLKERFTKLQEEHNKVVVDNKKKQVSCTWYIYFPVRY